MAWQNGHFGVVGLPAAEEVRLPLLAEPGRGAGRRFLGAENGGKTSTMRYSGISRTDKATCEVGHGCRGSPLSQNKTTMDQSSRLNAYQPPCRSAAPLPFWSPQARGGDEGRRACHIYPNLGSSRCGPAWTRQSLRASQCSRKASQPGGTGTDPRPRPAETMSLWYLRAKTMAGKRESKGSNKRME